MAEQNNDIEKYLSGELSPAERHALEQRALRDPFLSEALEGAEQAGAENFKVDIELLHRSIHEKTKRRKPKVITLNGWGLYMGIAAGLLLLAVSSFVIILMIKQKEKSSQLISSNDSKKSEVEKPVAGLQPSANNDSLLNSKDLSETTTSAKPLKNLDTEQSKQDKQRSGPIATTTPSASEIPDQLASVPLESVSNDEVVTRKNEIEVEVELSEAPVIVKEEKAKGEISQDKKYSKTNPVAAGAKTRSSDLDSDLSAEKIIHGKVISQNDGSALPGVNILIKGTNKGTVTDQAGNYEIVLHDQAQALVFSFIGLTSQELNVSTTTELNVAMADDATQLSEMVVTGYGAVADDDGLQTLELAEPHGGRKAFKKYLDEQLQYPTKALENRVEGRVTIQFSVEPSGVLTDFKVLKGLGYGCDEEAIRLIRQGPTWTPSKKNNQPVKENVKIRLKFDLPEK